MPSAVENGKQKITLVQAVYSDVPLSLWLRNHWHEKASVPFDISGNGGRKILWGALKNFLFIRLKKELSTHLFIN